MAQGPGLQDLVLLLKSQYEDFVYQTKEECTSRTWMWPLEHRECPPYMGGKIFFAHFAGKFHRSSHAGPDFQPVHVSINKVTWGFCPVNWQFISPDTSWKKNKSDKNIATAIAVLLVVMKELLVLVVIKTIQCKWQITVINQLTCFAYPHIQWFLWAQQVFSLEKRHLITKQLQHTLNYWHIMKPNCKRWFES